MILTEEEQNMLQGKQGEIIARQMRLLVRLGEIYHAERMVAISSAQISGVSYKSLGDPGLEFLEDIASLGARVRVLTYLNPAGMDLEDWEILGFPKDFAEKQKRILVAFDKMGVAMTPTCTPYLAGNLPRFQEHIAWAESSAVSFANSVLGARTNREGGPSALASAICGITPCYGLHLSENRKPHVLIQVQSELSCISDFGALGYFVGKKVKNQIPYFRGISKANTDELKSLGAAMASSGAVALYHVEGITPEASLMPTRDLPEIKVTKKDIEETYASLNSHVHPDIVMIGCPHASLREIIEVADKIQGRKLKKPLWICTSRVIKEIARRMGLVSRLEQSGAKVVADTCMIVSPIEQMGFKNTGVNSGKAANYLPGFCKQGVMFCKVDELIEAISMEL